MFVVIGAYQFIITECINNLSQVEQKHLFNLLSTIISQSKINEFSIQTTKMKKLISKAKYNDLKKYIENINIIIYSSTPTTISKERNKLTKTKSQNLVLPQNELNNNYISLTDHSEVTHITNVSFNNLSSHRPFEFPIKGINSSPAYGDTNVNKINNNNPDNTVNTDIRNNNSNSICNYTVNKYLPFIILVVNATLSSQQFIDVLNKALLFLHYKLLTIKLNNPKRNISVYEYTEPNCLNKTYNSVFLCKKSYSNMAIEIGIGLFHSIDKYSRIIEIKSISGKQKDLELSFTSIIKRIVIHMNKIRILKKSKWEYIQINDIITNYINSLHSNTSNKKLFAQSNKNNILIEEEQNDSSFIEETSKEASKYYHIYKILSQENYGLGQQITFFISNFKKNNSDISKSKNNIPNQMKNVINLIEDTVITFNNYFNSNHNINNNTSNYIRPSAEQFIFNKIYYVIFEIYKAQYNEENDKYITNREIIKSKGIKEIMKHLEIKQKYQGNDKDNDNYSIIPYKVSIDLINKIEYEQIPKNKIETLMKSSLELRNSILSMTNGKSELDSMDDELPLFIYLTTQISITNIVAELHFVDDYLKYSAKGIDDNKVITNLFSSVYYISNSWDK